MWPGLLNMTRFWLCSWIWQCAFLQLYFHIPYISNTLCRVLYSIQRSTYCTVLSTPRVEKMCICIFFKEVYFFGDELKKKKKVNLNASLLPLSGWESVESQSFVFLAIDFDRFHNMTNIICQRTFWPIFFLMIVRCNRLSCRLKTQILHCRYISIWKILKQRCEDSSNSDICQYFLKFLCGRCCGYKMGYEGKITNLAH